MASTKMTARKCVGKRTAAKNLASKTRRGGKHPPGKKHVAHVRPRRHYRRKSGTTALREIRRYQKSVELLIRKLPFQRLVREIAEDVCSGVRFQGAAILALQEVTEAVIVDEFTMTNLCAIHAKRITIQDKDMKLVQSLREIMTGSCMPGRGNGSK
ncbi:hypothetical protein PABG_07739 [Paracoccidioides brasiliensis Pb03]|nr:hypothetical protein PABG_07739 [Paracoccidioides brasiliensis Pb03]